MKALDKRKLLDQLERIQEESEGFEENLLQQMNMADALLTLTEINHEREYQICQKIAEYLLGRVPEPDDAGLEGEFEDNSVF